MEQLEQQALSAKERLDASRAKLAEEQEANFAKHKSEEEKRIAKLFTPASLLREREEYEQRRQVCHCSSRTCSPNKNQQTPSSGVRSRAFSLGSSSRECSLFVET